MYARVISAQFHPVEEAVRIYQESILPPTREITSLKGLLTMVDRTTGKSVTISLWETQADLQASAAGMQEQVAKVVHLVVGSVSVETYEVIAQL